MSRNTVTVHFTETFLLQSKGVLSEANLRSLADVLANDPGGSEPSDEVENLRFVFWPLAADGSGTWKVWYLTYPGLPHVEVVGFTGVNEEDADPRSIRKALWKIIRVGAALRAAYKLYEALRDHFG